MSRENVEVVRQVYEAVTRGDTDAVLSHYDPEIEWDFSRSPFGRMLKKNVYRGHDGIRALIRERYQEAWEGVEDELEELVDAGDYVVSVVTSRGRGRVSGAEVGKTHAATWAIRDGRIVRVVWLATRNEALEAAGLKE